MKKTSKKAKPEKAKVVKLGKGLPVIGMPFLIANLVAIGLALFYVYLQVLVAPADERDQAYGTAVFRGYAEIAKSGLLQTIQHANVVAQLPIVKEMVDMDAERRAIQEQSLLRQLGLNRGLRVLPLTTNRVDSSSQPPINNIVLDLLRKTKRDTKPLPEVVSTGNGDRYLLVVAPIVINQAHRANLLLGYDLKVLQDKFIGKNVSGYLELIQQYGKNKQVAIALGDKADKSGNVANVFERIEDSAWRIDYWYGKSERIDFSAGQSLFMYVLIAILSATLICYVMCFLALNKVIQGDSTKLTRTLIDVIGRRFDINSKSFTLRLFFDIASPLSRASKELHAQSAEAPESRPMRRRRAAIQPDQGNLPDNSPAETTGQPAKSDVPEVVETPNLEQPLEFGVQHGTTIDRSIFRAYDIRGVVGEGLTEAVVEEIGKAIGSEAYERGEQTVVVARDGRLSGPTLINHLKKGLMETGRDVIDIGEVPTPLLYFATHHLDARSGVMLTGSHNPPNYNGLKIVIAGDTLSGDDIQKLYQRLDAGDLMSGQGSEKSIDIVDEYIQHITNDIALAQPLRVVLDCGNGVCGNIGPKLLEALGCEVIPLYCEIDGNFPNHHPDPSKPENLKDVIESVQREQADIGLAFDGDGDRLGVVASDGKIIWPDRQLMLYAVDVLSRNPGADVIYDVKCTKHLPQVISGHGGRPLMWKTGHSLIKAKMKETGALLAGECSGHMFFKERWFGFDDGLYTAARLLEILGNDFRSSAQVFETLPEGISTPELNVALADSEKFNFIEKFVAQAKFEQGELNTIDGVRVDFDDGWGLVRASNTTPNLVIRFEADHEQALERIKNTFREKMLAVKPELNLPF